MKFQDWLDYEYPQGCPEELVEKFRRAFVAGMKRSAYVIDELDATGAYNAAILREAMKTWAG